MYTDGNAGANDDYLVTPTLTLTGNERLRFSYRVQSAGEPNDIQITLSTTGVGAGNFSNTLLPLTTVSNTTYQEQIINLSAYSGNVNIAFHVPAGGLDGWRLYIDDVTIDGMPACPDPTMLTASNITATTANLGWTNPSASTWDIEYGTTPFTPTGTPTIAGTTTNPHNLTGLTASTSYEFYVRADCGGSGTSNWVGPFAFYTGHCPVVSTNSSSYMDDFSTTGGSTNISNLTSGYATGGYEDATAMTVTSFPTGSVNFTTAFVGTTVGYNIWVDWNNDLDFNDPGETVYASGGYVSAASGTITVPGATPFGNYRMRMRCDFNATNPNACAASGSGRNETEYYTFAVIAQPANDLGVIEITSTPAGCGLGMEAVTIKVKNYGAAAQSNFDVIYELNSVAITPENVTATVNPGDTLTYVFTTLANMSSPAMYTVDAYTSLTGDADNNNDTLNGWMTEHFTSSLAYNDSAYVSNTLTQGTNSIICTNGLVNNMLDSCYTLTALVIDSLTHTFNGDLDIWLISPPGDTLEVLNR